jgi:peroxiredoxin
VVLLGISCDPAQKSKAWLEKNSRTLHTLTDSDFVASDAYKIQGVPALVLIGRDGKVKQYWEGAVSKSTLEAALNSLPKN